MDVQGLDIQGMDAEGMDAEYAASIADRAIGAMSQHGVPMTPRNFAVWFNYVLGASPSLRQTIDILVSNKRKFDPATNRDLYQTYIDPRPSDGELPEQLREVISSARQFLDTAIADNRDHIEALGEVTSQVTSNGDPRSIIEKLVSELSRAASRATTLEGNLASTSKELDTIRHSLKEAEERSNTDALTGLANRRSLDEFLRTAQIAAMEKGDPLSVLLIDIDHFKKFNDSYGHQVGDQVLRLVGKVLRESLRGVDLAARYGGEELIAVLPGADLELCATAAERIRCRIAEARLTRRTTGQPIASVTVSIGVAQFRLAESADALVERCDRALYQAKRLGRNRTITEREIAENATAA